MLANMGEKINLAETFEPAVKYLQRPLHLIRGYQKDNLRVDLLAGVTVAVVLLPQAIAFALIAELPPQMGLYTAIVAGIIGALWGSSDQMFTGPANAISLLVLSTLSGAFEPGSGEFIMAAGLLAVMAGIFQIVIGMARLGFLVNFVSHSVIIGFASGAGVLIAVKQLDAFLGIDSAGGGLLPSIAYVAQHLNLTNLPTAEIGVLTVALLLLIRRFRPGWPAPLISMIVASLVVFVFGLDEQGVAVIGQIPSGLPPLQSPPLLNLELVSRLSTGALAVGAIGLVQVTAITRSISAQTGQRLDSNQEFVGQGLANVAAGFFGGYNCAGSFSVTAVNYKAGARSPVAAISASLFVLLAMLLLGPLTAYLPRAALSGTLIVTAYGMIDRAEIVRIWRSRGSDAVIMLVTLFGTLFLAIEFAVLLGILLSLALYILRTSTPRVQAVLPDESYSHFIYRPDKDPCVQLGIIEILGDLYFGAVNYVEEFILNHATQHPDQRFLLIRMHRVNHCDFSGVHMLENIVRNYRDRGGDVFLVRVNYRVKQQFRATGFFSYLGEDNLLDQDEAVRFMFYHVLDPAVCIYECPVRAFRECQNLPKQTDIEGIPIWEDVPAESVIEIAPDALWQQLRNENGERPFVVDVREPREYRRNHIAQARSVPLSLILSNTVKLPNDRQIVLVCQSSRRSRRAASALQSIGCMNVAVLEGGMLGWQAAGLLQAVDTRGTSKMEQADGDEK